MMKLLVALVVVGLATVARSDEDFYSASAPQYYQPQHTSSYSNYQQSAPSHHGSSFLESIFGNTRRQGELTGILGGIGGPVIIIVVIAVIALGLFAAAAVISTSSGRGLDNDEWEVDHSVWMNQLQKDFEDSWATE